MYMEITTHTPQEVAKFLHKSLASVYSDVSRNSNGLPPRLIVPGSSKLLFCCLNEWAAGLLSGDLIKTEVNNTLTGKRGRGRPFSKNG